MLRTPMSRRSALAPWGLLGMFALLVAGCDHDHDHDHECGHIDPDGLVVARDGGAVAHQWQGDVSGGIGLTAGAATDFAVTFLAPDSTRITIDEDCEGYRLGWTIADTSIVQGSAVVDGPWAVSLAGRQPGATTMRLRLMHGDHADFTSLPLPVQVAAQELETSADAPGAAGRAERTAAAD